MKFQEKEDDKLKNIVQEDAAGYGSLQEQEDARLRKALAMTDMERFTMFCKMMRIGKMLASAKVTHKSAK